MFRVEEHEPLLSYSEIGFYGYLISGGLVPSLVQLRCGSFVSLKKNVFWTFLHLFRVAFDTEVSFLRTRCGVWVGVGVIIQGPCGSV